MRTKMTVPRAAAQERGGIKRKDLSLREIAVRNFNTLPIRAWVNSTADLPRDTQIGIVDKKGKPRWVTLGQIVEMVILEYQIQAYDNMAGFIVGMADRNKSRPGALGEPFYPTGPFKKAKGKK